LHPVTLGRKIIQELDRFQIAQRMQRGSCSLFDLGREQDT
jgi:hypothetical protein